MSARVIQYAAVPTFQKFHACDVRRRGVRGPVGSGKSTACCIEIMRRAQQQAPGPDGIRHTRWAVVRNSYRVLLDTTVATWLDWFPEEYFGAFALGYMRHVIKFDDVHMEVLFRALDRPQDVAKVLSLEVTGAWINEARELPLGVIHALDDRTGRFPAVKDGGCTWRGLIMDTNPPDDDHWWYRLAEEDRPEGWQFFTQPGGLIEQGGTFVANPDAENLDHLEPNFYTERAQGKSKQHIRVYYCGRYGFVQAGKPVYPEYADDIHAWKEPIEPLKAQPLYVGIDFGLTPAALFAQQTSSGRWLWIDELVTEDMGASRFAELLGPKLRGEYQGMDIRIFGDPAGAQRAQTDESTPFQILRAKGINASPAPTNDWMIRRDAVANPMTRLIDGLPGFVVSPRCHIARKGLAGGYGLKRIQIGGEDRYREMPLKNRYSHVCFASGTSIETYRGNRPIESLRPGDVVETPLGQRPVVSVGSREAQVIDLTLSNGVQITCTPDHPFLVSTGQWAYAVSLTKRDRLACRTMSSWTLMKWLRSAQRRSIRSLSSSASDSTNKVDITNGGATHCIASCGKRLMVRSPKILLSIIGMGMPWTIGWITSNAYLAVNTQLCMGLPTQSKRAEILFAMPGRRLLSGGGRIQAEYEKSRESLRLRAREHGRMREGFREYVRLVETLLLRMLSKQAGQNGVLGNARLPNAALQALTMRIGTALSAAAHTASTAIGVRKPVRVVARGNSLRSAVVHTIEVAEAHCFFAGGVLCSNCEAGQYAMIGAGAGDAVVGYKDDWDEEEYRDETGRSAVTGY